MSLIKIKLLVDTVVKKRALQSTELADTEKFSAAAGKVFEAEKIENIEANHVRATLAYKQGVWIFYGPHCEIIYPFLFDGNLLKRCLPDARWSQINRFVHPLNAVCREFKIDTPPRLAAFLATLAHESGSLRWEEELATGAAYEGRRDLGNTQPGDGRRYKGRGLIQLTGRHNYRTVGRALGLPLESNPELALNPYNSAKIAGYFWRSRNLNRYADWNSIKGFRRVTRLVNGGYNGWSDRLRHWNHIRTVLGCDKL